MNRRETRDPSYRAKHVQRRRIIDAIKWAIETGDGTGFTGTPYDVAISVLTSLDSAGFRVQRKWKRKLMPREQCPDCGERGEIRGHMTCQYPSND